MEAPRTARPGLGWCLCWALLGAGAGSGPLGGLLLGQEEPEGPFPAETPSAAVWEGPRRARQELSKEPPASAALLRLGRPRDAPEEGRRAPRPSLEEAQAPRRSPDGDRGGEGRGGGGGGRARGKREAGGPRRAKRGFTYPGTLWCGAGNIAASYDELGEHREADRCCREHDHCRHVIHPFTYKYGYRNFRWHTISHCDCDHQLKGCLRSVNDTASRVVGQAFFNVIQVPCFKFAYKEQCIQPYLYMWCKNYSTVAVAVIQKPVLYEYGGELIDGPVTRRTAAPAPATPSATVAPRGSPATTESTKGPGFTAKPDLLPKKAWKEKNRKGRKKGPKKGSRKGKGPRKNPLGKARVSPGPGAIVPPKRLEVPEVGKADLEGPLAGFLDQGEGDPFNAVLGDDPGGGTGLEAAEEDGGTGAQGKAISGTSPPAEPFGRKRKGRRQQARGRPASERRQDSRGRGI